MRMRSSQSRVGVSRQIHRRRAGRVRVPPLFPSVVLGRRAARRVVVVVFVATAGGIQLRRLVVVGRGRRRVPVARPVPVPVPTNGLGHGLATRLALRRPFLAEPGTHHATHTCGRRVRRRVAEQRPEVLGASRLQSRFGVVERRRAEKLAADQFAGLGVADRRHLLRGQHVAACDQTHLRDGAVVRDGHQPRRQ